MWLRLCSGGTISFSLALDQFNIGPAYRGQCIAEVTINFPSYSSTNFYCLVTKATMHARSNARTFINSTFERLLKGTTDVHLHTYVDA